MGSQNSRVETVEVATGIFDTPRQITVSDQRKKKVRHRCLFGIDV